MMALWLLCFFFAASSCAASGNRTKVVVLMMENRSFNHLFGFLTKELTGKEYNRVNSSDPRSQKIFLKKNPSYVLACDADHSTPATTAKIFGFEKEKKYGPGYAEGVGQMGGFVEWEYQMHGNNASVDYCEVMTAYTPDAVPIATFLAEEYALFTNYYSSLAGPTWPNRGFVLSGTSFGQTETGPWYHKLGQFFPQKLFPEQLAEHGFSWKGYYQDTPWDIWLRGLAHNLDNLAAWDQWKADTKTGNLPDWSFMWPRAAIDPHDLGLGSNDQHPNHDLALGEALLKEVYEDVRSSPEWDNILLLITWDEHGGLWDSHPPPPCPSPDDEPSFPDKDVKFTRLGIRVPLIAVSPRIPRGTRVNEPVNKPFPDSQFDHTSIMATTRKLFGMKEPLTRRDAWAATFEDILSLKEPRDTPLKAPAAPPATRTFREAELPINDLQEHMLSVHAHFSGGHDQPPTRQREARLNESFERVRKHFKALEENLEIFFAPSDWGQKDPSNLLETQWKVEAQEIRSVKVSVAHGAHVCLEQGPEPERRVLPRACSGSPAQRLRLLEDSTIRSLTSGLCLTVQTPLPAAVFGKCVATFQACVDSVAQHFSYLKGAPGNANQRFIMFGTANLSMYNQTNAKQ